MAEYNKVIPMFAGQGFTQGAAPKGILVTNGEVHCKDRYDTGFTLERTNDSEIFPIYVKEVITVTGTCYGLF